MYCTVIGIKIRTFRHRSKTVWDLCNYIIVHVPVLWQALVPPPLVLVLPPLAPCWSLGAQMGKVHLALKLYNLLTLH